MNEQPLIRADDDLFPLKANFREKYRWEKHDKIGGGGFGDVYKAYMLDCEKITIFAVK